MLRRIAFALYLILLIGGFTLALAAKGVTDQWANSFMLNLGTDMLGASMTFVLFEIFWRNAIEREFGRREAIRQEKERREKFIDQLREGHVRAKQAADELRKIGSLTDGTLEGIDLWSGESPVDLQGINLDGARLQDAKMRAAILRNASFRYADLHGASLMEVQMQGAILREANLQNVFLNEANLSQADLTSVNLKHANLGSTCLDGAILNGVNLSGAVLTKASLKGAFLVAANLEGAWDLTIQQLAEVSELQDAIMQDGNPYNGCFCLVGDLTRARMNGFRGDDPVAMASFYGVSIYEYRRGQEQINNKQLELSNSDSDEGRD